MTSTYMYSGFLPHGAQVSISILPLLPALLYISVGLSVLHTPTQSKRSYKITHATRLQIQVA